MSVVPTKNEPKIKEIEVPDLEQDKAPNRKPHRHRRSGWLPDLNPTQFLIFNDPAKYILGYGEKGSGKTVAFAHKIVRHCYENSSALGIIISPTQRSGAEGVWYDLLSLVLPQWMEGIGLESSESKLDPITKDRHIWIGNRFGGWSKLMLISIPHASMVRARVKGPAPSMVYIEEITECETREYFNYLAAQLGRRRGIAGPQQFMASCNPEGPKHWVYEVFFVECMDPVSGKRNANFSVYHVPIRENIKRLPPGYYEQLEQIFRHDEIEKRRLLYGEWLDRPSGEAIFKNAWNAEVHFIGDATKGIGLTPKLSYPVYIGHDPGPVNYSITFLQIIPTAEGKLLVLVFDELNFVEARAPFVRVVSALLRRMDFWDQWSGGKFHYLHVSDDSAFSQLRGDGKYDYVEIERLSKDPATGLARIKLRACPKGMDSVPARVRLIMAKLQTDELYVSARCPKTKEMFEHLESIKAPVGKYDPHAGFRPLRSRYLHPFDSLSYPVFYASFGGAIPSQAQAIEPQVYTMGARN